MPIIASIIASVALIISGWMYVQPEKAPSLGASQTISSLTEITSLSHNDVLPITDTAGGITKKVKWGTATATMKVINDALYSPIFSTSAGLAGLLSNESGTGVAVFNDTPSLLTPTLNVAGTDATGDIYYNGGSGVLTRLAIGSSNEFLRVSGGLPDWDNTALLTNPQTASSTFTATTSFQGSSLTNNALIINGLAYQFPSVRGASSTAMYDNGSGQLSFLKSQWVELCSYSAPGNLSTMTCTTPWNPSVIRIQYYIASSTAANQLVLMTFNGNTSDDYNYQTEQGIGGGTNNNNQATVVSLSSGVSPISASFGSFECSNYTSGIKTCYGQSAYNASDEADGATGFPKYQPLALSYASTNTPISTVTLTTQTGSWGYGSYLKIYGSSD